MKSLRMLIAAALVVSLGGASKAHADKIVVVPTGSAVEADPGDHVTRVAFQCDVSTMREGARRRVSRATLEWTISGAPNDRTSEFEAFAPTSEWDLQSVSQGALVGIGESPEATWEVTPMDLERNQGAVIRLDVTRLVQAWSDGTEPNRGIIVATPDVSGNDLGSQLSNARLCVRYVFLPE